MNELIRLANCHLDTLDSVEILVRHVSTESGRESTAMRSPKRSWEHPGRVGPGEEGTSKVLQRTGEVEGKALNEKVLTMNVPLSRCAWEPPSPL